MEFGWGSTDPFGGYSGGREMGCAHCSSGGGSVFVRWGRNTCPTDASLVYTGSAGGAHSTQSGNGYNILCMNPVPLYPVNANDAFTAYSRLFRVEFESTTASMYAYQSLVPYDAACAVCQRPSTRSHHLMIPGKTSCPTNYAVDYTGFLMGGNAAYAGRSEYTCFDSAPDRFGSSANENSAAMFGTFITDYLPTMDTYKAYLELSCIVCSGKTDSLSDQMGRFMIWVTNSNSRLFVVFYCRIHSHKHSHSPSSSSTSIVTRSDIMINRHTHTHTITRKRERKERLREI